MRFDARMSMGDLALSQNVYVVVPAYNEGPVLSSVLQNLLSICENVVVVDDGSTDDTYDVALRSRVHVLRHVANLGQGAALQTGIAYARSQNATYIATFDADGQHQVSDLPALLSTLQQHQADIALGSRFLGHAESMPTSRRLLLRTAVMFTRIVGGIRLTDSHNGLRLMTADAAQRLNISQTGMAHASEILHKIVKLNLKYVEVPITVRYTERSLHKGQGMLNAVNIVFDLLVRRLLD